MFSEIKTQLKPALLAFLTLTILTGIAYPFVVTGVAQGLFARQANGSIIRKDDRAVGSELIGQPFSEPKYFWSRPSATSPFPYNAASSGGSNLGPTNSSLIDAIKGRIDVSRKAGDTTVEIPVDLVTTSASGLDPHISPAAADYQVARVAKERQMPVEQIEKLVERFTEDRQWGCLGEARVNVLKLNLALDAEAKH